MTNQNHRLLKRIADKGGRLHLEGNVDVRPYLELEKLGWAKVTAVSMHDNVIEITDAGKAVAAKL